MRKVNSQLSDLLGCAVRIRFVETDPKGKRTFRSTVVFEGGTDFVVQYVYIRVYGPDKFEIIRALEQVFPDLSEEAIVYLEAMVRNGTI